jgi:HSP20 family protein
MVATIKEAPPRKETAPPAPARTEPAPPTPFDLLRRMTAQFDRVFDRPFAAFPSWSAFFERMPAHGFLPGPMPDSWTPRVDMITRDGAFVVRADLPGVPKEEIKIEVADNVLTLQGERRSVVEHKEGETAYTERFYGEFYRAIPLPDGADVAKVAATYKDGVLEIVVPMAAPPPKAVRRIKIGSP